MKTLKGFTRAKFEEFLTKNRKRKFNVMDATACVATMFVRESLGKKGAEVFVKTGRYAREEFSTPKWFQGFFDGGPLHTIAYTREPRVGDWTFTGAQILKELNNL